MVTRLFAAVLALLAGFAAAQAERLTPVPAPIPAPELAVTDLAGRVHTMADYRGRLAVVSFWASWCAPCRVEMPALGRLAAAIGDDEVAVLAVNLGDTAQAIERFLSIVETGEVTILSDPSGALAEPWHVVGLPVTYVVGPDGTVLLVALGAREWDDPQIVSQIRAAGSHR